MKMKVDLLSNKRHLGAPFRILFKSGHRNCIL